MDFDFFELKSKTPRFKDFLKISLNELNELYNEGKLSSDEILLLQHNVFYWEYAKYNYSEFKLTDINNVTSLGFKNWRDLVIAKEEALLDKKRTSHNFLNKILPIMNNIPRDIRWSSLMYLNPSEIEFFCEENNLEPLCSDENSELWKALYERDLSDYPPRFDTEYVRFVKTLARNAKIRLFLRPEFYSSEGKINENKITYKKLYKLFLAILELQLNEVDINLDWNEIDSGKILYYEKKIEYIFKIINVQIQNLEENLQYLSELYGE